MSKMDISIAIDFFIWLFSKKGKGCLHGKTPEQKHHFFVSLTSFAKTNPDFYAEQVHDLKYREYREYKSWLKTQLAIKKSFLNLINAYEKLYKS